MASATGLNWNAFENSSWLSIRAFSASLRSVISWDTTRRRISPPTSRRSPETMTSRTRPSLARNLVSSPLTEPSVVICSTKFSRLSELAQIPSSTAESAIASSWLYPSRLVHVSLTSMWLPSSGLEIAIAAGLARNALEDSSRLSCNAFSASCRSVMSSWVETHPPPGKGCFETAIVRPSLR